MRIYLHSYLLFCQYFKFTPVLVSNTMYLLDLVFLSRSLSLYRSVVNYLGRITHIKDHDRNFVSFLQRCDECGVYMSSNKLQLRMKEVPSIGHVEIEEGLRADPSKVRAIHEMLPPENEAGMQQILGMSQYLSKFLPRLSDITKPRRDLTLLDAEGIWDKLQQSAFECLKQAVSNLKDVTIQCDASQRGPGAALLQGGQPMAYASLAFTDTEVNYTQIEKELLPIVFTCEKFDSYIYGRDCVQVQTDHKPLESILRKELSTAPKRLQRMLLRLQKYSLDVTYLKEEKMSVADTFKPCPFARSQFLYFCSQAGRG